MKCKKRPCLSDICGFTLIELMIVVAILGILAVVAIPAFVRYMRVAKTAEAYRVLNKIEMGAIRYFSKSWPDENGTPVPCQFPGFQGSTPFADLNGCCTDGEPDGKCEPNEAAWDTATWRALLFKISDKHYYLYEFRTTGPAFDGYKAVAWGDLDCDGTYAIFGLSADGLADGPNKINNCRVQRASSMVIMNETE